MVGDGVPPWRSKTCAMSGKMGIVCVRYYGMMETVAVGRYTPEMQESGEWLREEDMHVDKDGSTKHTI